jgi:hypothetical protein
MSTDSTGHEPGEGFDGQAELVLDDGRRLEVRVRLRGHLEPIDGRFHWWGRIAPSAELDSAVRSGSTATVETPYGAATGRLSDVDPWGRLRVTGTGRPPF